MAWLESHQALRDHPKKDRLAELLFNGSVPMDVADYAAAGLLHYLWYWALDYAQDGSLAKFSDVQIAKGCRWHGDAHLLVQSLMEAGFIDKKPRRIHDWDEYGGRLLAKRQQDKARTQTWRKRVPNADVMHNERRTDIHTYKHKQVAPVDNSKDYCPNDGATLEPDGHCPVCGGAS